MNQANKNNYPSFINQSPWDYNTNTIWLGSTLTLNRNLEKFNFPGKLTSEKRKQIISLVTHNLLGDDQLKHPKLLRAEELLPIDKQFLSEHFLSSQSFHQMHMGEAFVIDDTGEFLAVLNLKDHILLEWIDPREDLENTWSQLLKIELSLAKSVNFAFSPKFGFLTSDPAQCGTGFIVTIFLHLPSLIYTNRLDELMRKNKEEGVEVAGLQGSPDEVIGDIVAFRNSYTLGVTEENIIASLRTLATKLVVEEKGLRQQLKQGSESETAEIKDKVSRAYAISLHSYQLEVIEALQALSFLKIGIDLGWLKGTTQSVLNRLLFACRQGHLLFHYDQKISNEELSHKRAEFIHKALQGLELLI